MAVLPASEHSGDEKTYGGHPGAHDLVRSVSLVAGTIRRGPSTHRLSLLPVF